MAKYNSTSRLSHISIDDNLWFSRKSAMERCFSPYKNNPRKATADTGDACDAWFPKAEYVDNTGVIRSGAQDSNWKNHFENGGKKIIQWLYDGEYPTDAKKEPSIEEEQNPLYCFWCEDRKATGEKYKYVGTYVADVNASEPRRVIFRRLRTDIDLTPWYIHGGDFSCRNTNVEGIEAYQKLYIEGFRKQKELLVGYKKDVLPRIKSEEAALSRIVSDINGKSIADFEEYLSYVSAKLREFLGTDISVSQILSISDWNSVGRAFVDLSQATNNNHNRIIRESVLGQELASKVLALYNTKFFLYSLSEKETEFYLDKLNLSYGESDDITEKHCLLYFWKQCNIATMENLTPYEYYRFLKYVFIKDKVEFESGKIDFPEEEQSPIAPINKNEIISITEEQVKESEELEYKTKLEVENLIGEDELTGDYSYIPKPEKRVAVEKGNTSSKQGAYPRDPQRKLNALMRSGCTCEVCPQHESFISKRTGKRYVETHHIIPLEFWESFENSLDVEANIATLCSNCHNEIHYGINAIELVERLYEMRAKELEAAGIGISKEQLIAMYEGLYYAKYLQYGN